MDAAKGLDKNTAKVFVATFRSSDKNSMLDIFRFIQSELKEVARVGAEVGSVALYKQATDGNLVINVISMTERDQKSIFKKLKHILHGRKIDVVRKTLTEVDGTPIEELFK